MSLLIADFENIKPSELEAKNVFLNDANKIEIKGAVKNVLRIKSNQVLKNAQINITDLSGRKVFSSKTQDISGLVEIPVALENGTYMMTIISEKEKIVKKIMVKK